MEVEGHDNGIVSRQTLLKQVGRRPLERAVAAGDLVTIDRSTFALPGTHPVILMAARTKGTLTCLTALRRHGVWTIDDRLVHLSRTRGVRSRCRLPPGACDCQGPVPAGPGIVAGLDVALSAVLACHDREHGIVALDSIIRQRLLSPDEVERVAASGGERALQLLARADGRVESALESVLRHRLVVLGVRVRTQVWIPDLGRVDMLVGKSLIIEADGFEFHSGTETFRNDRRRDREALRQGYRTVRLTWADVFRDWGSVLPTLLEIFRTREHRRSPRAVVPPRVESGCSRSG